MRDPFIKVPFASGGDKSSIPDATQPSGSISMQSGWGGDYEKEVGVDPAAKSVNRQDMNQILYVSTALINRWQTETFPEWIDSSANGGSPYPYPLGSVVRYSADGVAPYLAWVNNIASNATAPSEANGWILFSDVANRSQQATESVQGTMKIATQTQTNDGILDAVAVTPKKLRVGFSINLGDRGFITLPTWLGGLIIQWGVNLGSTTGAARYSFPLAFPTACKSIVATVAGATAANSARAAIVSSTQFDIASTNFNATSFAADPIYWIAIGY